MKAISLWQPWASAIALGLKRHETRGWTTRHRGPIAIHAAKRWTPDERDWAAHFARILGEPRLADPPRGAIVAVANLVDVIEAELLEDAVDPVDLMLGNYGPGRFGWRLEDVVALAEPVPCVGRQGMFDIDDAMVGAVQAGSATSATAH